MSSSASSGLKRLGSRISSLYRRVSGRFGEIASGPAAGLRFDADADTPHFLPGKYELPVQEMMASLVKPGQACYDIGANLGFFTLLCARLTGPSGVVYAFEPVPRNAAIIERNALANGFENIEVHRVALNKVSGSGELLLAKHVGGAVLESVGVPPPDFTGRLSVTTAALDDLARQHGLRPPDIVKLDVEGAELDVLQGMAAILRTAGPIIVLEVDDATRENCEAKLAGCAAYLRDFGYETTPIPNAYKDGSWFVRHFVAKRPAAAVSH